MPRPPRVVFAGVPHHVTQRGNRRGVVFFCDADRWAYLALLRDYAGKHGIGLLAYCLMPNHVHLVLVPETAQGLHLALKPLHMRHAQRINRARGWSGHLWQGRYFSSPLDENYLWAAIRYVERNPVRAGLIDRAEDYGWSSAAAHCGVRADALLTSDVTWTQRLSAVSDWSAWLATGDEAQDVKVLRRRANKGLPCGSTEFVAGLERTAGRCLQERPRGRGNGDATP